MPLRIFITGGTGTVGSASIRSILRDPTSISPEGVSIRALARSSTSASTLEAMGAIPVRGDVSDLALLTEEASKADVVLYCAFDAAPKDFAAETEVEGAGIAAVCKGLATSGPIASASSSRAAGYGEGLKKREKIIMYCGGVMGLPTSPIATEKTEPAVTLRKATKAAISSYTSSSPPCGTPIRAVQIRLGGVVHTSSKPHVFYRMMIKPDHIGYFGDGSNTWPAANGEDVGELVAAVLRQRDSLEEGLTTIHAFSEQVRQKDIADALGSKLGVPARAFDEDEYKAMGKPGEVFFGSSPSVSNEWTIKTFGWKPKAASAVEAIEQAVYIKDGKLVA